MCWWLLSGCCVSAERIHAGAGRDASCGLQVFAVVAGRLRWSRTVGGCELRFSDHFGTMFEAIVCWYFLCWGIDSFPWGAKTAVRDSDLVFRDRRYVSHALSFQALLPFGKEILVARCDNFGLSPNPLDRARVVRCVGPLR